MKGIRRLPRRGGRRGFVLFTHEWKRRNLWTHPPLAVDPGMNIGLQEQEAHLEDSMKPQHPYAENWQRGTEGLRELIRNNSLLHAHEYFNTMRAHYAGITMLDYEIGCSVIEDVGNPAEILDVFQELRSRRLQPSSKIYAFLLKAYLELQCNNAAEDAYSQARLEPGAAFGSCAMIMMHYHIENDHSAQAAAIYQDLQSDPTLHPHPDSYNAMIEYCGYVKDLPKAIAHFKAMVEHPKISPNYRSYEAMAEVFLKFGEGAMAARVLSELRYLGFKVNKFSSTRYLLFDIFTKTGAPEALSVLSEYYPTPILDQDGLTKFYRETVGRFVDAGLAPYDIAIAAVSPIKGHVEDAFYRIINRFAEGHPLFESEFGVIPKYRPGRFLGHKKYEAEFPEKPALEVLSHAFGFRHNEFYRRVVTRYKVRIIRDAKARLLGKLPVKRKLYPTTDTSLLIGRIRNLLESRKREKSIVMQEIEEILEAATDMLDSWVFGKTKANSNTIPASVRLNRLKGPRPDPAELAKKAHYSDDSLKHFFVEEYPNWRKSHLLESAPKPATPEFLNTVSHELKANIRKSGLSPLPFYNNASEITNFLAKQRSHQISDSADRKQTVEDFDYLIKTSHADRTAEIQFRDLEEFDSEKRKHIEAARRRNAKLEAERPHPEILEAKRLEKLRKNRALNQAIPLEPQEGPVVTLRDGTTVNMEESFNQVPPPLPPHAGYYGEKIDFREYQYTEDKVIPHRIDQQRLNEERFNELMTEIENRRPHLYNKLYQRFEMEIFGKPMLGDIRDVDRTNPVASFLFNIRRGEKFSSLLRTDELGLMMATQSNTADHRGPAPATRGAARTYTEMLRAHSLASPEGKPRPRIDF